MIKAKWIGIAATVLQIAHLKPLVRAGIQRRLEAEADGMIEEMKRTVEVDKGNLRDSIRREPGENYPGVKIIAGSTPSTTKPGPGYTVDEALIVEYGTVNRTAEPFFRPVIDRNRRRLKKEIVDAAQSAAEE